MSKQSDQIKRFQEAAQDLGCDTSDKALEKAFGSLKVQTNLPAKKKAPKKASRKG